MEERSRLLGKNREYLLKVESASASKVIKIESNILMILRAVESDRAQIERLKSEAEKNECNQCPTNEM